jgi:hypothetical protein
VLVDFISCKSRWEPLLAQEEGEEREDPDPLYFSVKWWHVETRADNDRGAWIHASPLFLRFPKSPNIVSLVTTVSPNKSQSSEGRSTNSNYFWTNCNKIVKILESNHLLFLYNICTFNLVWFVFDFEIIWLLVIVLWTLNIGAWIMFGSVWFIWIIMKFKRSRWN